MLDQQPTEVIIPRPHLHWLIFVQTLVAIIFQIISISQMARVLFYRFVMPDKFQLYNMSKIVIIYMIVHILGSLSALPYHFYVVFSWRRAAPLIPTGEPLYDPYTLYLMGIFMATYFYTPAIPVFFLTLDRCIALKFPIHYTKSDFMKRKLPALVITCTFIFTVAILISLLAELPLDIDKVAYCEFFECVTVKYNGIYGKYMKLSVVILNILCTAYFFYALWTFRVFSGERNIFTVKNRVVIVAAASELILNVCPTVFTTVYTNIEQESPSRILGNYTIPLLTLDAVICSVFYVKIYLRKNYQINNAGNRRAGGNVFQINNSISPKGNLDSSSQSNSNRRK